MMSSLENVLYKIMICFQRWTFVCLLPRTFSGTLADFSQFWQMANGSKTLSSCKARKVVSQIKVCSFIKISLFFHTEISVWTYLVLHGKSTRKFNIKRCLYWKKKDFINLFSSHRKSLCTKESILWCLVIRIHWISVVYKNDFILSVNVDLDSC